jgi:hypothetical protein
MTSSIAACPCYIFSIRATSHFDKKEALCRKRSCGDAMCCLLALASLGMVLFLAFLLVIDVITGQDGGVHLVLLLFFGMLFIAFIGLSKVF